MKFGICSDIRNVCEIESYGYDYIEGKLNQIALWEDNVFEDACRTIEKSNIKIECCSLLFPKNIVLIGNEYDEKTVVSYLKTAFSKMNRLSCSLVVFGSGKSRFVPKELNWQDSYKQLVSVTKLIGKIALDFGIDVAIEPLNRSETNLINSLAEGAALQADVNMSNVGLLADAYHMWQECEDFSRIITCSPFMHIHIAEKGDRLFPVKETVQLREFFSLLKKTGYDKTMSFEGKSTDLKADSISALETVRRLWNEV